MIYRFTFAVWDSWGSQETGILEGNVRYLGHYHECKLAKNEEFGGKWCVAYYGFLLIVSTVYLSVEAPKHMNLIFATTNKIEAFLKF